MNPEGNRRYKTRLRPLWHIGQYIALADLFFLLLFFMLMASSVVRISGIKVNLPKAEKVPKAVGLGRAIVSITPPETSGGQCQIYFRDQNVDLQQLKRLLLGGTVQEKVLVIRADQKVPAGMLYEIMSAAESANMESFIAVQQFKEQPETSFVE